MDAEESSVLNFFLESPLEDVGIEPRIAWLGAVHCAVRGGGVLKPAGWSKKPGPLDRVEAYEGELETIDFNDVKILNTKSLVTDG
jgi:hypothetical protein